MMLKLLLTLTLIAVITATSCTAPADEAPPTCVPDAVPPIDTSNTQIVINELYYKPFDFKVENFVEQDPIPDPSERWVRWNHEDDGDEDLEFVELYNPSGSAVNITGWDLEGFVFPASSSIAADEHIVVASNPDHITWFNSSFQIFGPSGFGLKNGGEKVTLEDAQGVEIDEVDYDDKLPWSPGARAGDFSLERIAHYVETDNAHSWRASTTTGGTPGASNAATADFAAGQKVLGRPLIQEAGSNERDWSMDPNHPESDEDVEVKVKIDLLAAQVKSVVFRYENAICGFAPVSIVGTLHSEGSVTSTWKATIPAQPHESLVRFNLRVELLDCEVVDIPHQSELPSVLSYFVYDKIDNEILKPKFAQLWTFGDRDDEPAYTYLPNAEGVRISAAVFLLTGETHPVVYENLFINDKSNKFSNFGKYAASKIKFLAGREFMSESELRAPGDDTSVGDRSLNFIPHNPRTIGSNGAPGMLSEWMGFFAAQELGGFALNADVFRHVSIRQGVRLEDHALLLQQYNDEFLEIKNKAEDGELWKYNSVDLKSLDFQNLGEVRIVLEPHKFKEGNKYVLNDLLLQLDDPSSYAPDTLMQFLADKVDLDQFANYMATIQSCGMLDSVGNNHWIWRDDDNLYRIIPWDLDRNFGSFFTSKLWKNLPIGILGSIKNFRRGGVADASPFLDKLNQDPAFNAMIAAKVQAYINDGKFEDLLAEVETRELTMLADLSLMEVTNPARDYTFWRENVDESFAGMKKFLTLRKQALEEQLGGSFEVRSPELIKNSNEGQTWPLNKECGACTGSTPFLEGPCDRHEVFRTDEPLCNSAESFLITQVPEFQGVLAFGFFDCAQDNNMNECGRNNINAFSAGAVSTTCAGCVMDYLWCRDLECITPCSLGDNPGGPECDQCKSCKCQGTLDSCLDGDVLQRLAHYGFEDKCDEDIVRDSQGSMLDGTSTGSATSDWGYLGLGHSFTSGTGNVVLSYPVFNFAGDTGFSFSLRFKLDGNSATLFGNMDSNSEGYSFEVGNNDKMKFRFGESSQNQIDVETKAKVQDTDWHSAVITYDGLGTKDSVEIYLDGMKQEVSRKNKDLDENTVASTEDLTLGTDFGGSLDEFTVYGKQLDHFEAVASVDGEFLPLGCD